MREFVMRTIMEKPIIIVEQSGEILAELKRQGNNLNQAVKNNYNGKDTEIDIRNCIFALKELYRKISAIIGGE